MMGILVSENRIEYKYPFPTEDDIKEIAAVHHFDYDRFKEAIDALAPHSNTVYVIAEVFRASNKEVAADGSGATPTPTGSTEQTS